MTLFKDVYNRHFYLKTAVFLYMMPCRLIEGFKRFVRTYCLKPQGGGCLLLQGVGKRVLHRVVSYASQIPAGKRL